MMMKKDPRIYVAGHRGMVGSAIGRELTRQGFTQVIGRTHAELDLMDAVAVRHDIDPTLIASRSMLVQLSTNWDKYAPELMNWQRELLAEEGGAMPPS